VPNEATKDIKEALMTPGQNYGKDSYTIDLMGSEATYWLGTESGLLGAFHFDGACTAGDGSCDVASLSMGAGFCNLNSLEWLTEKPLTPTRLCEQRSNQSHRVGREEEGLSSNRPELVALRECLKAHPDHENLLYLTDSEATLQAINKWIGGGAKLSLAKTADADILRAIIVKLQQRVKAKAATLLIKVKAHRGCPLNEEADIRAEMGRMKQEQEKTWNTLTNRTIYQWSEASKTKRDVSTTKQTAYGPRRSATECDRKQGRSKLTVHTRRERRSGRRSTCREKVKEISLQKVRSYWKTKTSGERKLSFTESYTNPENEKDPTKTVYSCHTKKDQSHPHSLPTGSSGRDRDENCWENG
jgi:ribonuclease HI